MATAALHLLSAAHGLKFCVSVVCQFSCAAFSEAGKGCHQCVPACSKLWQGISLSGKCRAACSPHYTRASCSKGLLAPGTKLRNFIWEVQAMHEATAPASGSIWYLLASSAAGSLPPSCAGAWRHHLYLLLLGFASNSNEPGRVCSCQRVWREPFPLPCCRQQEK